MQLPIALKPDVRVSVIKSILIEVAPMAFVPIIFLAVWAFFGTISIFLAFLLGIGVLLVLSLRILLTALNAKATTYKITPEGVYFFEGFFTKREKFLPMKRITDIRLIQRWPIDIWFKTGTVILETAGRSSSLGLRTLSNPRIYYEELRNLILKMNK
ncbi:MAG TPA: PH domain-containing protein [Candidatus Nanoarchaeia archaeon]|nr:PH domain-containing protein [Candidatus Nanoarchaeia archaeon]